MNIVATFTFAAKNVPETRRLIVQKELVSFRNLILAFPNGNVFKLVAIPTSIAEAPFLRETAVFAPVNLTEIPAKATAMVNAQSVNVA